MTVDSRATQHAKILEQLSKLKAKEESLRLLGNLAEAELFSAKVAELLLKYKLTMDDVEERAQDLNDPMDAVMYHHRDQGIRAASKFVPWMGQLSNIVARAHFCRVLVYRKTNDFWIVGRKSDREIVIWMYTILCREIDNHVDKEYRKLYQRHRNRGDASVMHGWRAGFLTGVIKRLGERFDEMRKRVTEQHELEVGDSTGTAIVRRAELATNEYFYQQFPNTRPAAGMRYGSHAQGIADGRRFANGMNLNRNGVQPGSPGQPALPGR